MTVRYRSDYYLPTRKEDPQQAEIASHRLMVRAGMIRRLSQGLYTYLPLAQRVLVKIKNIVREEMNRAGAQEVTMPILQPRELWEKTGRWEDYGPEMMRLEDRRERSLCLGPTHEEVITDLVKDELRSYRDTPVNLYQIATKFRDEIRPRFGLLRAREFVMKDAYSFDADESAARESYREMDRAYRRIFDRMGFEYSRVEAATGAIGGSLSHEFMVLADTGEDQILYCSQCDYAANQEQAESEAPSPDTPAGDAELEEFETPGVQSIDDLMEIDPQATPGRQIKTLVTRVQGAVTALLLPGDYDLNEVKLDQHADGVVEAMTDAEIEDRFGAHPGSLGAVNLEDDSVQVWADPSLQGRSNLFTGANRDGYHYRGVDVERDLSVDRWVSLKRSREGDRCVECGASLQAQSGIEVGHIFYLGTKYSEALGATIQNEDGQSEPLIMGCYGIGISRIMAAAVEQSHDEQGIIWPDALAPFHVYLLVINWEDDERREAAETLAADLEAAGMDVLVDDREESAGVKFNESELLGIPYRVTVGRDLQDGEVELLDREKGETVSVAVGDCVEHLAEVVDIDG